MDDLSNKKCVACEGNIPPFDTSEIHRYLKKANTFNAYRTSGHSSVVERLVANEKVVGSSPIARSIIGILL